jgi:hypothetical protein
MQLSISKLGQVAISVLLLVSRSQSQGISDCIGQGAGSCNLAISGVQRSEPELSMLLQFKVLAKTTLLGSGEGSIVWLAANIYDHSCNEIGHYWLPRQGLAIDSQLPWTVVLKRLANNGNYDNIGMCYGSYCFQGDFACHRDDLDQDWEFNICMHGFNC